MNGNGVPIGGILLPGEREKQDRQQAMVNNIALSVYVPLIPSLTIFRLARGYEVEGGLTEPATPERIAHEARMIAEAAVKEIAVQQG